MQRSESIAADGATSTRATVGMAVGSLQIAGGATDLMEADFTYDEKLVPRVSYVVEDAAGILDIEQQADHDARITRNEWDIRFNGDLPLDLRTNVAAAGATFDMDALRPALFDVHAASGSVTASLAGRQPQLRHVHLETASGDIALRLNGDYNALTNMRVRSASGQVDVTLGNSWQDDLDARIESVSGKVTVRVPQDIGVVIGVSTISGKVDASGAPNFQPKGRTYVNAALGTTDATLQLRVSTISGGITIIESD